MATSGKLVTAENRQVARYAAAAFGGKPSVREFVHDTLSLVIDILSCADGPGPGFTSYSTVGLSDYPMLDGNQEFPTRVEIAGLMASSEPEYRRVLGSAAFRVMRTHEVVRPGRVFRGYVAEYFPETHLPHLYFTSPFYWGESLASSIFGHKRVTWLLAMPISEAELDHIRVHGDDAFESLLELRNAQVTSLQRPSVV